MIDEKGKSVISPLFNGKASLSGTNNNNNSESLLLACVPPHTYDKALRLLYLNMSSGLHTRRCCLTRRNTNMKNKKCLKGGVRKKKKRKPLKNRKSSFRPGWAQWNSTRQTISFIGSKVKSGFSFMKGACNGAYTFLFGLPPTLPAYHFRIIVLLLLLHINNKPKNQLQPCEHTEEAGASLSF